MTRAKAIRQVIGIDLIILAGWLLICLYTQPPAWVFVLEVIALAVNTVVFLIRMNRIERTER